MPETALSRLLPPASTPLERALADTCATTQHGERVISSLYRPDDLALPLVPWLAWSVDVLAWPRRASEATRRRLVAESWRLHRLQGTLAGFRIMADLCGSAIVRAITPPAKIFTAAALTTDERNAFIARYPQLRIYPKRLTGKRVGAMLIACHPGGHVHPMPSDAAFRLAPRAFLYRDGTETPLDIAERTATTLQRTAQTVTEIRAPGHAGPLAFCGASCRWPGSSDADHRVYRLVLDTPYQDGVEIVRRITVDPGLSPLTVRYDWVAGLGHAEGIHAGRFVAGHFCRSTALERIYKRLALFDPEISVARRVAILHTDAGRLGMPAHHAELLVSVPGRSNPQHARRFVRGFFGSGDRTALHDTLGAMRSVARTSDRIAIDTAVINPITAGEQRRAGRYSAGDWR